MADGFLRSVKMLQNLLLHEKMMNAATSVVDINKAHVVMLMDQKIIQQQDGAKILKALSKLSYVKLDLAAEDVHMAVEEAVLKETGPEVGGNLHVGKSRNDQVTTAIRMQLRNELIQVLLKVLEMQASLIDTATNTSTQ